MIAPGLAPGWICDIFLLPLNSDWSRDRASDPIQVSKTQLWDFRGNIKKQEHLPELVIVGSERPPSVRENLPDGSTPRKRSDQEQVLKIAEPLNPAVPKASLFFLTFQLPQ